MRVRLAACVRDRLGVARRADAVDRLLQYPPPPFDTGGAHPRRGIQDPSGGEIGGLTTTRTELIPAAKLSNETEPPQVVPADIICIVLNQSVVARSTSI